MSVDTRTPQPGFDDQPALSMIKVDCDPAQVIVNHASFRVQLAQTPPPARALEDTARIPAVRGAGAVTRRRAPVVWSGRSRPGDLGATGLLQAVRDSTAERDAFDMGATQVIPRIEADGTDAHAAGRPLVPPMRQAVGAYDYGEYDEPDGGGDDAGSDGDGAHRLGTDSVRHAYYPGRRMNLGVVLLPLRVFLGFISIYAGMGKLCDPVYFDGGERGSMVKWLNSLHPWPLAEPLRDFALSHPVGAGLSVAFLQVVVGVLTVLGLWQRVAAVFGVLLSAALLLTVSWKTVPAYDAPDIIFLAAWSPLIIAGAPVYSADGRLAGEAWRKLGPRSELWELRRRVLRRGSVIATVVVGLTLLIGSMLGGAVRSTDMVTVPDPNQDPTNHLPGSPLPEEPAESSSASTSGEDGRPSPSESPSGSPEDEKKPTPSKDDTVRETGSVDGEPSQTQGTGQRPPGRSQSVQPPAGSSGPSSSGGSGSTDGSGWGSGGGSGGSGGSSGSGSDGGSGVIGGLLG
ncbi:DoxX family membrane protein [Streptomyces sp. NPDC052236]|uniref:DoxX family membrane protein n=1 Tax=Streptomyces sp. NPDC052236 TaxID=3365686 RepID=UPI0037D3A447